MKYLGGRTMYVMRHSLLLALFYVATTGTLGSYMLI